LISFHSLIAISMFVLWCILHLQYPSIISCFFFCALALSWRTSKDLDR
jgi:hypothetical protein